jgi:hypothetical protein
MTITKKNPLSLVLFFMIMFTGTTFAWGEKSGSGKDGKPAKSSSNNQQDKTKMDWGDKTGSGKDG